MPTGTEQERIARRAAAIRATAPLNVLSGSDEQIDAIVSLFVPSPPAPRTPGSRAAASKNIPSALYP